MYQRYHLSAYLSRLGSVKQGYYTIPAPQFFVSAENYSFSVRIKMTSHKLRSLIPADCNNVRFTPILMTSLSELWFCEINQLLLILQVFITHWQSCLPSEDLRRHPFIIIPVISYVTSLRHVYFKGSECLNKDVMVVRRWLLWACVLQRNPTVWKKSLVPKYLEEIDLMLWWLIYTQPCDQFLGCSHSVFTVYLPGAKEMRLYFHSSNI